MHPQVPFDAVPLQQLNTAPLSAEPGGMQTAVASRPASWVLDALPVPEVCVLDAELVPVPVPVLVLEPDPEPASLPS
jgi:hypothetical protein